MSRYARIDAGLVVETLEMANNFDPDAVIHKFDWRIIILQPDPAYDPATQKLQGFTYVVYSADVEATRKVVALNQDELDEVAEQAERDIAKTFYAKLNAGTATNAEVQKVVARLLKDAYQ